MGRWLGLLLIAITVLFGASYASAFLFQVMGPWTAVGIQHDGTATFMEFGAHLPRPEWVPVYPGATVAQASRITSPSMPSGFHGLDLATRASFEEIRRFYVERLETAGFEVTDHGIGALNPATAAYLGIAGMLSARRAATGDEFNLTIGTPDGLFGSRLIQSQWRKAGESLTRDTRAPD
jgi:hypothetical protein